MSCRICDNGGYCRLHPKPLLKEEKPIAKQSDKMKQAMKEYTKSAKKFKAAHPNCFARIKDVCTGKTTDIHHMKGKKSKEDLLDEKFWLPVCRACHNVIEKNPLYSRQQGFSVSRLTKPNKSAA